MKTSKALQSLIDANPALFAQVKAQLDAEVAAHKASVAAQAGSADLAHQTCIYPACNCPFDAPADPTWCARGLPKSPLQ